MKIALIAPVEETVPPQRYGGTEWIVYDLAHGLGKKGHEVDLYAAGNSKQEDVYNLVPTVPQSIRTIPEIAHDNRLRDTTKFIAYAKIIEMLIEKNYDIVHNHCSWRFLLFSKLIKDPILTTHHGPLNFEYQNIVYRLYKNLPYVSISDNQRKDLPELNFIQTVYNGIDLSLFPFNESQIPDNQSPMLFLARLSTEKGPLTAAQVAHATNKKLVITAKVDSVDQPNYDKLQQYIDSEHVEFHGEITPDQRSKWLTTSRCLLVPIQWEEPFGLMFVEAMASGTPVITFSRGSAPEIIKDGETGFLVNQSEEYIRGNFTIKKTGIDGLKEAVERIYAMPDEEYKAMRKACREHVEKYFTVNRMVDEYEEVYKKIIGA